MHTRIIRRSGGHRSHSRPGLPPDAPLPCSHGRWDGQHRQRSCARRRTASCHQPGQPGACSGDVHLAVHGVSNVYVASSPTFVTSGQANYIPQKVRRYSRGRADEYGDCRRGLRRFRALRQPNTEVRLVVAIMLPALRSRSWLRCQMPRSRSWLRCQMPRSAAIGPERV